MSHTRRDSGKAGIETPPEYQTHRWEGVENPVLFEAFEWNLPSDCQHWNRLRLALPSLKDIGIDHVWLPPGSKAKDVESNGYDIYDPYDLGEFDQKGTVATKWGTKQDLDALADESKRLGMGLVWDAILNHRGFADSMEMVKVVEVDPKDRRLELTEPYEIKAWTKFDFAGRGGKYSSFTYNKAHFNGTDWNQLNEKRAIYRFVEDGKDWAQDVGSFQGNADYLMLENLDYTNEDVVRETNQWGRWIMNQLGLQGFRLDAVQHYSCNFVTQWAKHLSDSCDNRPFFMGEYWNGDVNTLTEWLDQTSPTFFLYDVPLMSSIARLSMFDLTDMREVFKNTLVETRPDNAVTFIRLHDTQPGQEMDTSINADFYQHAYSLLLLRRDGYPCVFFGDLYGLCTPHLQPPTCHGKLADICLARKLWAYGEQVEYFESSDCIGWLRRGNRDHPSGIAITMSWGKDVAPGSLLRYIAMSVGKEHAGEVWTDLVEVCMATVVIDGNGFGKFPCQRNSVSCFVNEDAAGRERFPVGFDPNFFRIG